MALLSGLRSVKFHRCIRCFVLGFCFFKGVADLAVFLVAFGYDYGYKKGYTVKERVSNFKNTM